jgi:ribose 5-phosphate isomerase A
MSEDERLKRAAAERALDHVRSGMRLGLGSGSTSVMMVRGLGARLRDGRLYDLAGVPTSEATAALAREMQIPLVTLADCPTLDLALDGADEIDPALNLIKGLGGALLREKIVVASAERFIVIGSEAKLVMQLGERSPLPVEIIEFARPLCERRIAALGARVTLRQAGPSEPYRTDEGNLILDCQFSAISDPLALGRSLMDVPGVVGHGLFPGMASLAVIAGPNGVRELPPRS